MTEEVSKIFGKDGKNKFKTLLKNTNVYTHLDNFKEDIEILANKAEFDELLSKERLFIKNESFDLNNVIGQMILTEFGTLYSKSNLATIKAIHGVEKDVYQYEVQLGSNGPMYIGWATQECVFDSSSGVGNTINSYGFNGYRKQKWNTSISLPYGQKWRVGNVIGCVINFSQKTIEYFNNGQSLGKAFEEFNIEGMTYFPAFTLFNEENLCVNLGERQFKFPIPGAKPVIANPTTLIDYFKRLELNINSLIDSQISLKHNTKKNAKTEDKIIINNVINNVLVHQLTSLLKIPLIVDSCFVSFLNNQNKKHPKRLTSLFELMWENISENEMIFIMGHLLFSMLCEFKCTWRNKFDISHQVMVLKLLIEIFQETNTRKQMIVHIIFNKIKFAHFLHIVAPSDEMFETMVPVVYWSIENIDLDEELKKKLLLQFPRDYKSHKSAYKNSCDKIKRLVNENLQMTFLRTLLNDNDQTDTKVSSRILFCRRFQSFIQENMIYWRNDPMFKLPSPVLLSTFFRMSFLIRELWNEELKDEKEVKVHSNIFYLENYNYFGIDRIGGTFSYLRSKYQKIIKPKLNTPSDNRSSSVDADNPDYESISSDMDNEIIEINSPVGLATVLNRIFGNGNNIFPVGTAMTKTFSFDHLPTNKIHILSVLLNNIICLYHVAGHRQLIEYVSFKDRLTELSIEYALLDYELRTTSNNNETLEDNLKEMTTQINLALRHISWLMSMVFLDSKQIILEWIIMIISNTIKYSSENEEELFRFVPEFYVDNLLGLMVLMPDYTNTTQQFENIIIEKKWLASLVGELLLKMFADIRIVHPKSKESITQGIILYLTHPKTVEILQLVSEISRTNAIKAILKPEERNTWAKTNVILMLIWHGSGFAFRYTRPPHLENQQISIQGTIEEIVFSNMGIARNPAKVLQDDFRTVIINNREIASNFMNNSLNYLNWAFSEFISLFQEVKDINNTSSITSEEINKLKMCGKSFIMTVCLLRVIEMVIYFDSNIITDQEGSLGRVFQLICQILNRIHSSSSTFQQVLLLSLPHLECVHKFIILTATIGFLLSILDSEIDEKEEHIAENDSKISSIPEVTDVLISDPNFSLSSFDFIILPPNENGEPFSFNSYEKYLTKKELQKMIVLYQHLDWYMKRHKSMASSINEDVLCIICYSNKNSITLVPCGHQCCKLCINHHILYSRLCFYCKGKIDSVVDINDSTIILYDFGSEPPPI
ncbi:Concanavalin A-like lectin/glucanase domain,SPRY domain,Zinc finger, RING-type,B30.2/SPRY domain [Cinara cedri]|uniref:Concanavalin A-like lectin/glucanase domain,SPRY domain,Zinc finger, RING-type,B30.2/SPRY domain n=1 Tax=Cinara cedri TaxID=506608 RepID=A0A5E4M1W7_9HEMI|nr:Concanavalin A-like lectin/glucanase domain,SPRY domain,Zinc finger, RING-type,B30.2/SPRY domain [Cinara cedri]